MSFKEYLSIELVEDGIIEDESDLVNATRDSLFCETSLDYDDIDGYYRDYEEYCANHSLTPIDDLA